jgi:hypothetical protein
MRNIVLLSCALCLSLSCKPGQGKVNKITENGVEVVLNGLEPIHLKGAPSSLVLEEEMALDTEKDEVADTGLTDIGLFGVDSEGNIYFTAQSSGDDSILKFDRQGHHIASFGRKGQGPGEIQRINALFITDRNEVAITNEGNNRLTIFDAGGHLLREVPMSPGFLAAIPLANGNYFLWDRVPSERPGVLMEFPMTLASPDLKTITSLDTGIIENPMSGEQLRGTYHLQSWSVSRDKIFTGHQDRGYDIFVYDLEGSPIRKIRKEYKPVPVPESHKREFLKQFESPQFKDIVGRVYFPAAMPPFIGFTSDEEGRLYVLTYETGGQPGEFISDVFDSDRKPINIFQNFIGVFIKVRNDRLYCVQEKESGYKEFKVYRMIWK